MLKLKRFISKRPDWFKRERGWRLAQVLRLGPTVVFLVFAGFGAGKTALSVLMGLFEEVPTAAGVTLVWTVGAAAYVIAMHWLLRWVVWIVDGFKSGDKAVR